MFHKDEISQKLVDIHKAIRTHLTVMDGLIGMEGLGPRLGSNVPMNLILAGQDVAAVDAVTCTVMDIEPGEVETAAQLDHLLAVRLDDDHVQLPLSYKLSEEPFGLDTHHQAVSALGLDLFQCLGGHVSPLVI